MPVRRNSSNSNPVFLQDTSAGSIGTSAGTFPIADVSVYNDTDVGTAGGKLSGVVSAASGNTGAYLKTIFGTVL